jgi:hypothetical protein
MPDETLLSRITRYHFLSGNKTEAETFRDLFDVAPFQLSFIPKQLGNLASRLPGVKESNFNELLEINTYFPAYKPFIGYQKTHLRNGTEFCQMLLVCLGGGH